jgi:dephospho-CoA kinase
VKLVGLTGGIASGKSTVAAILRRLGAAVIDADELSRQVVQPEQTAWKEIVKTFGAGILQEDQNLDRKKLRKIVFDNPEARKKLEVIIHPKVRALAEEKIRELASAGASIIVYEVPLLFEGQLHHWLRPVILVACDVKTQKKRIQDRDHVTGIEAQRHIDAQMSLEEKRKLADYTIENNGTLEELEQQVKSVVESIKAT